MQKCSYHTATFLYRWYSFELGPECDTISVKIHYFMSVKQPPKYCVPQGSVKGPLLFTMHMTPPTDNFDRILFCADDILVHIGLSSESASEALG